MHGQGLLPIRETDDSYFVCLGFVPMRSATKGQKYWQGFCLKCQGYAT
eukprot:COSAG01_NODE_4676_length_4823_cov_3.078730_4_plen_48_part_00